MGEHSTSPHRSAPNSTLASPVPLSEIQNGLVGENETPQGLTRLGSVACAGIDPSEMKIILDEG